MLKWVLFRRRFYDRNVWRHTRRLAPQHLEGVTLACINNPKVVRSSDKKENIGELHWSIQNTNELVIHALTQAGYDVQCLKATLMKSDEGERQITQLSTHARQEALAAGKCARSWWLVSCHWRNARHIG